LINNSWFLLFAWFLSQSDVAFPTQSIGIFSLIVFLIGLRSKTRNSGWFRRFQSVALLAMPVLLLIGMIASMIPPAIANFWFLADAAVLANGYVAYLSYLTWSIGVFLLIAFLVGLRSKTRNSGWVRLLQSVALLVLPVLLLVGTVVAFTDHPY